MTTAQLATAIPGGNTVRAMRPDDLDAVAALDARIGGRMRRGYFVRRLESALAAPERHVQLAAEGDNGTLAGFIFYLIEAGGSAPASASRRSKPSGSFPSCGGGASGRR